MGITTHKNKPIEIKTMEMVTDIIQWIVIICVVWAINNLGTAIKMYGEALKAMCEWEDERRKRENQ